MNASPSESRSFNALFPALAFIVIGLVFLLRNFDMLEITDNWWAFFFLIPIAYSAANYWRFRQAGGGKFSPEMRNALIGIISMSFIMCVFLFNWNWSAIWPAFLIIGGLFILLSAKWE